MADKTKIEWTNIIPGQQGATWNPLKAINTSSSASKVGYFCIMYGPGCENCYARRINMTSTIGNGLDYKRTNLPHAAIYLSGLENPNSGQTSIEWPLRAHSSKGIFAVSMSDWVGEFVPVPLMNVLISTMMISQHHIFLTLTKRDKRLHDFIVELTRPSTKGLLVSEGKVWNEAIARAQGNLYKWPKSRYVLPIGNRSYKALVPWPPNNMFFGVSIANEDEARSKRDAIARIRDLLPTIKLMVSYEPALGVVDWHKAGYDGLLDWLIVGGESGEEARPMPIECLESSIEFSSQEHGPKIFIKQMGSVYAQNNRLLDSHGTDVPDPWLIREFPDVSQSHIPWKSTGSSIR